VVKWFILVIVLVFDPLSICLVLAYNFLIKREETPEEPKTFAIYDEKPVEPEPTVEEPVNNNPIIEESKPILDPNDPYPQYMTKEETEQVLERWWKKRNGVSVDLF
jgi:hypothetical protein